MAETSPITPDRAHLLFDELEGEGSRKETRIHTSGIGDGGNEIGMGKVPWDTIRRNIPNGGLIACRVPADHLIVAGVSNRKLYALAGGVLAACAAKKGPQAFSIPTASREASYCGSWSSKGRWWTAFSGRATAIVDGLELGAVCGAACGDGAAHALSVGAREPLFE